MTGSAMPDASLDGATQPMMPATAPAAGRLAIDVAGLTIVAHKEDRAVIPLVKDISFTCRTGEVTALIGESGSGKSLTAAALLGLLDPAVYEVNVSSATIAGLRMASYDANALLPIRGTKVGYVVQDPGSALDPTMKIGDQLAELFVIHRGMTFLAARHEVNRLLDQVRIPQAAARYDDYPHAFSGGMKQRVIIAGAIALGPDILIADEPTTALDVTVQAEILSLIDELRTANGMSVLLITHDLGVVYQVAEQVLVMYAGRIVESGHVEAVCTEPAHPYTAGLLASVPDLSGHASAAVAIPGNPPVPGFDEGCSFRPRCMKAQPICDIDRPQLQHRAASAAACHFPVSGGRLT